jgi:hypothetical protein
MAMANREPIDDDSFRSGPDTLIAGQQNPELGRLIAAVLNTIRLLKGITDVFMRHLLIAMHESRRKQALTIIARFDDLVAPELGAKALNCEKQIGAMPPAKSLKFAAK